MGSIDKRGTRDVFERFRDAISDVRRSENFMAITQAQFDTDLAAYNTAVENLITAANNAIQAAKNAGVDLTAEDAAVQKAAADVATEMQALNPTPPPSA